MISVAFLITLTFSQEVLLSVWPKNEACGVAPQQIYVFIVNDPLSTSPTAPGNLRVPSFYSYMAPPYPYNYCGNLQAKMSDECCFSSIHNYQGVQSGIAKVLDSSVDLYSQFPITANSNMYCRVYAGIQGNSFPYKEIFALQNGECLDNFQCMPSGKIRIYDMPGCSETFEEINSNAQAPQFSSTFGNITTQLVTINSGSAKVGWVTYYPGKDLVPRYQDGLEVMQTTLYVACIIGQLLICVFLTRRYRIWKTQQLFLLLCTQAFLFVFISFRAAYYYAIFESNYAMWGLGFTQQFLFGASTLACSMYTCHAVVEIVTPTEANAKNMYLTVVIVHFFLAGSSYLLAFQLLGNFDFTYFLYYWSGLWQVWITVYLLSNIIPLSVVMLKKIEPLESGSSRITIWEKLEIIHQMDPYYYIVISASYLLALLYLIISIIQSTTILGKN